MRVFGEVFQVKSYLSEIGLQWHEPVSDDWYEYEVNVENDEGIIVYDYISLFESYNGLQRLTEGEAQRAMEEMIRDIEEGGYDK